MPIRLHLLGPLDVRKDGQTIALPARKTEALLAVLSVRPGVGFGREQLTALLWPEVSEAQGRTSLRQALGHLRRCLGPELIVSTADRLHLEPSGASVDVVEAERLLRASPMERERLAELWRGPFLDGFSALEESFDEWLTTERLRLTQRTAQGLEECLGALSAAGHADRALMVGARLLEIEPAREAAHRAVMRLYSERGDRTAALKQYERCRDLLERQFGVTPAAETERLRREIVELTTRSDVYSASPQSVRERAGSDERLPIAVVPFEATAGAATAQLLAQGLTEDVTTELSRFRQLAIIARSSLMALAARGASVEEVAHETGARLVLCGGVRVAGDRVRVTARLVDATTHLQVWAERWDASHEDTLDAIDRLTRSVVSALALRIDEARLGAARRRPREQLQVYECWLRGLDCLRRGTPASDDEARAFFEQALALSPAFARAYSGISLSHFNDWSCQAWQRWEERERLAFENARRAVELDDGDHVTHCILGRIHVYRREFDVGKRHLDQMLALNANDADMLIHAALAYAQLGEPERARELMELALFLNPKHPDWYYPVGALPLFLCRQPEQAIVLASRAPNAVVDGHALLAAAHAHLGSDHDAREHGLKFLEMFRRKISPDREPASDEPVRWLLRVNPLRRSSDVDYLLAGLERAGVVGARERESLAMGDVSRET